MLNTQFSDASGRLIYNRGLGDSSPAVTALQQSLVKYGQMGSNGVTGAVNDATVSALWKLLGADLTKAQSIAGLISSDAATFVGWLAQTITWINNQVASIPGASTIGITTASVLNNWSNINSVLGVACTGLSYANASAGDVCSTVVSKLDAARAQAFSSIASKADMIKKIVDAFGAPPGAVVPGGSKPGMVDIRNLRVDFNNIGVDALPSPVTSYPPGSIARFNTTRKIWSIYRPITGGLGIFTDGDGALGKPPAPPPGFLLLTTAPTSAGAKIANPSTEKDSTIFTSWWFWTLLAAAVGGAGVVIYRRKKHGESST